MGRKGTINSFHLCCEYTQHAQMHSTQYDIIVWRIGKRDTQLASWAVRINCLLVFSRAPWGFVCFTASYTSFLSCTIYVSQHSTALSSFAPILISWRTVLSNMVACEMWLMRNQIFHFFSVLINFNLNYKNKIWICYCKNFGTISRNLGE